MNKTIIALTGIQGSGKGSQASLICKSMNLKHVSPGDALRKAIHDKTPEGLAYEEAYKRGELAPVELVNSIMKQEMESTDGFNGLLLDGFPRSVPQMEWLLSNYKIDAVISLVLDKEIAIKRLMARGREDDNEEGIRKRIQTWKNETKPLWINYATKGKYKTLQIDAYGSIESVYARIMEALYHTMPR